MLKSLICVFLLVAGISSQAQLNKFGAAINAGFSTSQIHGDGYGGYNKAGFKFGAASTYKINENVGLQFEISYVDKGSTQQSNDKGAIYKSIQLRYIEIPVSITIPHKKFVFETGLGYGRLLSEYQEDVYGPMTLMGPFSDHEVFFNLGVNYNIYKKLFMNWRFSQSILPVTDSINIEPDYLGIFGGSFNIVMAFTVYYHIADAK